MRTAKKISIISPSLVGGGAEKVAVNLANTYAANGHVVDLVVFKSVGPYKASVSSRVNLVDLNVSSSRYALLKVRRYLKANSNGHIISVIRGANIIVGLASIGLGIDCLIFREANTMHGLEQRGWLYRSIQKGLTNVAYRQAAFIVANSKDTRHGLLKYKLTPIEKIRVIPNPVLESDYWDRKNYKVDEEWLENCDLKVILSVGRLHKQKNFPFLISAFKEVYKKDFSARLLIIGEGAEKANICRLIHEEQLSSVVKIINFKANVYPYYNGSDVFALASAWEGFGNVLVEALSVGLPVVCTDCPGGPRTILRHGKYGVLIPVGDKHGYVKALYDALQGRAKSSEAIAYARDYTASKVSEKYFKLMQAASSRASLCRDS